MKLLVIGSKGFIGRHCVKYFMEKYEVWSCDIVVDYDENNYFTLDPVSNNFEEVFSIGDFDLCVNCSGAASVQDSYQNPQRDFILNTYNVFKILDAIRKYNPECKFINLSSAAVYGNPVSLPVKENQVLKPISPYGMHKKMAEAICSEYYDAFKVKTCSCRIFSAYGPGLKKQLFWDLDTKRIKKSPIKLFGTGNETRDFIYVSDLVQAIESIILNSDFKGEVINVGNGVEIKIAEAVKTFYDNYPNKLEYQFDGQNRQGDPIYWVADIEKLKLFGYKQKVSLKEGLSNYYKWLEERK